MAEEDLRLVLDEARDGMRKSIEGLQKELARIRTGRANPSLLDSIHVEYYGSLTPLNKLATVAAPEARLLVVQPFDPSSATDIERAIIKSDLGLTTVKDGKLIRVPIPELTEERRKALVKNAKKACEEHKIGVRGARRDALALLKTMEKDGEISEDDSHRAQAQVQQIHDEYIRKLDDVLATKEKEILHI
jgi:ribosome recycling factor